MDQVIESDALARSEEGSPRFGSMSSLQHDCLAQWVVALDEPVIALMKFFDQPCHWHPKECELLDRRRFASQAEARMACFSFIEGWYNPVRLHSALGYRSPMAYEVEMRKTDPVA
jgi:transposase InsO family protein